MRGSLFGHKQGFTPVVDAAHLKVDRRGAGPFHQRKQCIEVWQGTQSFIKKKAEPIESREGDQISSSGISLPWSTRRAFDQGSSKLNTNGLNRFTGDQAQHHFGRDPSHF